MTVIFLPIEPLEERYTAQMLRWVEDALKSLGVEYRIVLPATKDYQSIKHGQWLDTYSTTRYRSDQISLVATQFENGFIKDGDVFLVGDVWYPGIEAIRLMADLSHIKIKIAGWHYAGTADPADLLHRELGDWARTWEHWLMNYGLDAVCVGSEFHKNMLRASFGRKVEIYPLGLAWQPDEVKQYATPRGQRSKIVVFPHRIAPEKDPEAFYELARIYKDSGWQFVVSTNNARVAEKVMVDPKAKYISVAWHKNKQDYYKFLAQCSIYYSNATQETFGYSLHEAIALGLAVVAPMRCSYPEGLQYDPRFLFDPLHDPLGLDLLGKMLNYPIAVPYEYTSRYAGSEKEFISKLLS